MLSLAASASTAPIGSGDHAIAAPEAASIAVNVPRPYCPRPPAKIVVPFTASASAPGRHSGPELVHSVGSSGGHIE